MSSPIDQAGLQEVVGLPISVLATQVGKLNFIRAAENLNVAKSLLGNVTRSTLPPQSDIEQNASVAGQRIVSAIDRNTQKNASLLAGSQGFLKPPSDQQADAEKPEAGYYAPNRS